LETAIGIIKMFKSCLLLGMYVGYCIELITWWSFIEHMVVNIDTC